MAIVTSTFLNFMELTIEQKIFGRMQMMNRVVSLVKMGYTLPLIEIEAGICDLCGLYSLDDELEHFYYIARDGLNKGY